MAARGQDNKDRSFVLVQEWKILRTFNCNISVGRCRVFGVCGKCLKILAVGS